MYQPRVLSGALTKEQREAGLHLVEGGAILELRQHNEHIAFFSSKGAKVEEIQSVAQKHLGGAR